MNEWNEGKEEFDFEFWFGSAFNSLSLVKNQYLLVNSWLASFWCNIHACVDVCIYVPKFETKELMNRIEQNRIE